MATICSGVLWGVLEVVLHIEEEVALAVQHVREGCHSDRRVVTLK